VIRSQGSGVRSQEFLAALLFSLFLVPGPWLLTPAHAQVGQVAVAVQPPAAPAVHVTWLQSAGGYQGTYPFNVTANLGAESGNGPYCLVVTAPYSASDVTSVTDPNGDSFTGPVVASNTAVAVYYAAGLTSSPASVSAVVTDNPGSGIIAVDEYGSCGGVDGTPSITDPGSGGPGTWSTNTETASHSGDVIWGGFVSAASGPPPWTPGTGFSGRESASSSYPNAAPCAYASTTCDFAVLTEDMATNAGMVSAAATVTGGGGTVWAAIVVLAPPPPCGATSLNLTDRCNLVLVPAALH
jgi:hypothetical protein